MDPTTLSQVIDRTLSLPPVDHPDDELITEVFGYCDMVLDGRRLAGHLEKLAVCRFIDDLHNAPARGWWLDWDEAAVCLEFFPACLRHSVGMQFAGKPFKLSPYQAFIVLQLLSWKSETLSFDIHPRRFIRLWLEIARKNGKTAFFSALLCFLAFFEPEPVAEIYCVATKEEQSARLWHECRRMIEGSPELDERAKITGRTNVKGGLILIPGHPQNGTFIKPLGCNSRTSDSLNIQVVALDEMHEWRATHRELFDKLDTASGSRVQPLQLAITTAGDEDSEVYDSESTNAISILEEFAKGRIRDDRTLAFIATIDEDDDPLDPQVIEKSNPNLGISISREYLEGQRLDAVRKPTKHQSYCRYHANVRTSSFVKAFPLQVWSRGGDNWIEPQRGDLLIAGFDLSRSRDWSSLTFTWPLWAEPTRSWCYRIRSWSWCCDNPANPRHLNYRRAPFSGFVESGRLTYQEGNERVDHTELKEMIVTAKKQYKLLSAPYDSQFAAELAANLLNDHKVPTFDFYQTFKRYTPAVTAFEDALVEGRIQHENEPLLSWQAGNSRLATNTRDQVMIVKGTSWRKVDGMVAGLMSFSEAVYHAKKRNKGGAVF